MPPADKPSTRRSVSASPVMKITGTVRMPGACLSRRQVSKPSMPGMQASSSTASGVMRSSRFSAVAPSVATSTV